MLLSNNRDLKGIFGRRTLIENEAFSFWYFCSYRNNVPENLGTATVQETKIPPAVDVCVTQKGLC